MSLGIDFQTYFLTGGLSHAPRVEEVKEEGVKALMPVIVRSERAAENFMLILIIDFEEIDWMKIFQRRNYGSTNANSTGEQGEGMEKIQRGFAYQTIFNFVCWMALLG